MLHEPFKIDFHRNFTYIKSFGTNHGWLVGGEQEGNSAGSIVDIDTAHIPLFNLGTTNPNMVCLLVQSLSVHIVCHFISYFDSRNFVMFQYFLGWIVPFRYDKSPENSTVRYTLY